MYFHRRAIRWLFYFAMLLTLPCGAAFYEPGQDPEKTPLITVPETLEWIDKLSAPAAASQRPLPRSGPYRDPLWLPSPSLLEQIQAPTNHDSEQSGIDFKQLAKAGWAALPENLRWNSLLLKMTGQIKSLYARASFMDYELSKMTWLQLHNHPALNKLLPLPSADPAPRPAERVEAEAKTKTGQEPIDWQSQSELYQLFVWLKRHLTVNVLAWGMIVFLLMVALIHLLSRFLNRYG